MLKTLLISLLPALVWGADAYAPSHFAEMKWRMVGPIRGGRTRALAGVPSQASTFYVGAVNGGVWKTNDFGRTWKPIFDDQPTGSIGSIAVAQSDPSIIYVGSGEGLQRPDLATGDGMYKSIDAGKTWVHLGLRDSQQIPHIAIDPRNPNRVFAAVLGHPYGPNPERGIFRSINGGTTFEKVLYKDENTGGSDVAIDPSNPDVVYAGLWESRQGPWENGAWNGTNGGMFKSTNGGVTWRKITKGLPDGVTQVNIAIAPSKPSRLFSAVATGQRTGLYRSDDSGESWTKITEDTRAAARIGGGDLPVTTVDPRNPDIVYSASVVTWKSTDGGKTWAAIRGAPGGDDYQQIWINPFDPQIILIASDQGAIITVNGGQTWSSWFNQATAAMYHVAADNAFPYRLCSGQQDSGSACVSSRGNDGQITYRDWHPAGIEEYGYAAPDPLDPDLVYGGKVTRYDRRTGQIENVSPKPLRDGGFRAIRTQPLQFSPVDPHTLFFAANTLWKTRDGGRNWQEISPDLSRKTWDVPDSVGKYRDLENAKPTRRGVIYAIAPSPLDVNRIWAGTDDGLIHMTTDGGKNWKDVTPPMLKPWMKVAILEAGHFDANTAYAAINTIRLDDMRPHIVGTHDGGKTWTEITTGIPDGAAVDAVREDPKRKGLLFAGTETQVYVSFNDGAQWQSLRLNMPAVSIRDIIVKDDDLVAGTHGRGFWILDDITPLRQIEPKVAAAPAFLYKPETAIRVRWNMNSDTPVPPDEPGAANPPEGAILNYVLGADVKGPVSLEILDSAGKLVRVYSSDEKIEAIDPMLDIPKYWLRPPSALPVTPGMHRFQWNLRYAPVAKTKPTYPMTAILNETAPAPTSPWVMPGNYTVRLTAGGQIYSQPLTVKLDPRVKTSMAGLTQQHTLAMQVYRDIVQGQAAIDRVAAMPSATENIKALAGTAAGRGGGRGGPAGAETLNSVKSQLEQLLTMIEEADAAPNGALTSAVASRRAAMTQLLKAVGGQ